MLKHWSYVFGALLVMTAMAHGGTPVAHWDFEQGSGDQATDVSGNNHHGTLTNMDTNTCWVTGKVGNYALQFDGDDDFVQVGSVGISGNAARTICGWAKASTYSIPDWTGVFGFAPNQWGDNLFFDVEVISGGRYGLHVYGIEWAFCPVDTNWHHFAATYDGNNTIKLYLDGIPISTQNRSNLQTVDSFVIGVRPSHNNNFPGLIDDVRVYNYALTDAEILAIASMGNILVSAAFADDPDDGDTVLGSGDTVFLVFDVATNKSLDGQTLTGTQMDSYFHLSGGHSWGDSLANYTLKWVDNFALRITVTAVSNTTLAIGDTITIDASANIKTAGDTNTCTATSPPLSGNWGTGTGVPTAQEAVLVEIWSPLISWAPSGVLSRNNPPASNRALFYTNGCSGPQDIDDSHNMRLRGYIYPPESGDYTFLIQADDDGEVWLSYDDDPAHIRLVATGNYEKAYGTWAEGATVYLETGRRYYIEACVRESGGGDKLVVGWKRPSASNGEAIPATAVSPVNLDPAITQITATDPNFDDNIYDTGDTITIVFNLHTNKSSTCTGTLSGTQMDQFFALSNGHSWGTSSAACSVSWLNDYTLQIVVLDTTGATVAIGDTLTVTTACGIKDSIQSQPTWQLSGTIGGDWGIEPSSVLILYYNMDETSGSQITDYSGNNYHGTLNGATLPEASVQGQVGKAIQFTATGQYVECGNPALVGTMSEYTICLWVKPNDTSTAGYGHGDTIIGKESGGGNGFQITWDQEGSGYRFGLMCATVRMVWTPADKQNGTWYHVAAVWKPNEGAKIYINGTLDVSDPGATYTPNPTANLRIACFGTGGSADDIRAFQGTIDEVRIYSRALSQEIIQALCAATVVSIQATDATAKEGASPETGTFTVTRTGLAYPELVVRLDIPQGSGYANHPEASPSDYTLSASGGATIVRNPGTGIWMLTIPANVQSVTITLTPVDDSEVEAPENATITILSGAAYTVATGQGSATVVIQDDDVPGSFTPVAPANGSTELAPPVTLQWNAAANADYYSVHLAITYVPTGAQSQQDYANIGNVTSYQIPSGVLTDNMKVDWTVTAHNAAGDTPMTGAPWTFYTPDTWPPRVTGSLPSAGTDYLDVSGNVKVFFSEAMDPTTTIAAFSLLDPNGTPVAGTATLSADGRTLTFDPAGKLSYNSLYTIVVANTAEDIAGNRLDGNANGTGGEPGDSVQISFRTKDELPGLGAQVSGCGGPLGAAGMTLLLLGVIAAMRRRA